MSDKVKKEIFNSVNENVQALAKLFPSVVKDGEVDFDALKEELGEFIEVGAEKYDFTWAGKSKAKAEARDSGEGLTLKLKVGEGVNEDTTQNIYIEGDNLKALKLLRNSYYGAIKMIYIDPPYNTGSDFVYRDNFTLSQVELDKLGNNLDDEGNRLEKNSGDSARYHTDWLNMMYPRLKIAKDLLSDDGVIFISIGEVELANLRKIADDIFEPSNYITTFIWEKTQHFGRQKLNCYSNADYIVCYAKRLIGEKLKEILVERVNSDLQDAPLYNASNNVKILNFPAGVVKFNMPDGVYEKTTSEDYILLDPVIVKDKRNQNAFRLQFRSRWADDTVQEEIAKGTTFWVKTQGFAIRAIYGDGKTSTVAPKQILFTNQKNEFCAYSRFGDRVVTSEVASSSLETLMGKAVFSYPKPVSLIKYLISALYSEPIKGYDKDFIALDFFSGSATTAQAIMQLNSEDEGSRKFVLVQLQEDLDKNLKEATTENERQVIQNAIYLCDELNVGHYITEVAKERIRRAGAKIKAENGLTAPNLDIGFKVFEVAETNIRMFSEEMKGNDLFDLVKETDKELRDFMPETKDIDVCYELLLRHRGVALSSSIEKLDIGERTYIIADSIVVCLDSEVTEEMVEKLAVIDPQPMKYIFRDSAFGDDISLKENTMIMLSALIEKTTGESKKAYKVEFI